MRWDLAWGKHSVDVENPLWLFVGKESTHLLDLTVDFLHIYFLVDPKWATLFQKVGLKTKGTDLRNDDHHQDADFPIALTC